MATKARINSLDFIKICATIAIIFHHYEQNLDVHFTDFIDFWNGIFYWGHMVELFFILSGFVMYKMIDRIYNGDISFGRFYFDRYKRFAPLLIITVITFDIVLYAQLCAGLTTTNVSIWHSLLNMLALQSGWVFDNPMIINPQTWYISGLMLCYVMFFLTTYIAKKLKCDPIYLYVFFALFGYGIYTFPIDFPFFNQVGGRGFYPFFWGVVLSIVVHRYDIIKLKYVIPSALIAVLVPALIHCNSPTVMNEYPALMSFVVYPAIIIVFLSKPFIKAFSSRIWAVLGQIQYHVFMWHMVLILCLQLFVHLGLPLDLASKRVMFAFAAFAELFGAFSYFILDKPLQRLLSWMIPQKKTSAEISQ